MPGLNASFPVHNLIFVHADKEQIQDIKKDIPWLQWLTRSSDGRNIPIIVPDRDMEQFIQVTQDSNEKLVYLRPDEIDLRKGTPIRYPGRPIQRHRGHLHQDSGSPQPPRSRHAEEHHRCRHGRSHPGPYRGTGIKASRIPSDYRQTTRTAEAHPSGIGRPSGR